LKFCWLRRIADFCPLVCGLTEIIEYECVSLILLHSIKLYLCFKLLVLVHLLIPCIKIVTVKYQLMYECLVQRINLEFINTKATGYCKTLRKETLQHPCTGTEALLDCTVHRVSRSIAVLFLDHGTRRG